MVSFAGLMGMVGLSGTRAVAPVPVQDVPEEDHGPTDAAREHIAGSKLFDVLADMENTKHGEFDPHEGILAEMSDPDAAEQLDLDSVASDGHTTAISDFTPEDESLLFVWDDSVDEDEPDDVSVQSDPENAGELQVWFGDRVVAQVSGPAALIDVDIALIPFSSAQALALVEAETPRSLQ